MNLLKYIYFFINLIITVFASLPSVGWILLVCVKLNLFNLFEIVSLNLCTVLPFDNFCFFVTCIYALTLNFCESDFHSDFLIMLVHIVVVSCLQMYFSKLYWSAKAYLYVYSSCYELNNRTGTKKMSYSNTAFITNIIN